MSPVYSVSENEVIFVARCDITVYTPMWIFPEAMLTDISDEIMKCTHPNNRDAAMHVELQGNTCVVDLFD